MQWFEHHAHLSTSEKGLCENFKVKIATGAPPTKPSPPSSCTLGVLSTMSLAGDSSWFSCILTLAFEQQQQGKASLKCGKQLRPHVAVINQPEKCIRGFEHNDVNTAGKSNFQWNITCNWKFDFDEIIAIPPSTFKELLKMGPTENIQRILLNSTLSRVGVCV